MTWARLWVKLMLIALSARMAKQRMLKMVNALEESMGQDIDQLDWMTPATKKEALAKLHKIEDKIGYPDHWRDYSSVKIVRGDLGQRLPQQRI